MPDNNSNIAQRFEEFGAQLCESSHGWKKIFAEKLGISPNQLTGLLSGRDSIGPKMQKKLRDLGADVDYILTGRNADGFDASAMIQIKLPGHVDRSEAAKYRQVLEKMLKVSKDDPKVADKILIMIDTMYGEDDDDDVPPLLPRFDGDIDENRIHKERLKKRAQKHVAG